MKKLSFEKFAVKKIETNQLTRVSGGGSTGGGCVELQNYCGSGSSACVSWESDETGAGGGITYCNETVTPC